MIQLRPRRESSKRFPLLFQLVVVVVLACSSSMVSQADDTMPPTVLSTEPADRATAVDPYLDKVSIVFSEPMRSGSQALTSNWGPYSISWAPDGRAIDLIRTNPEIPLPGGTAFFIILNTEGYQNFQDLAGNPLGTFTLHFTTAEDDEIPTVISTDPPNGSNDVNPSLTTVSFTFSEPMNPSVSFSTYGDWATASYSWSQDQRTVYLTRLNAGTPLLEGTAVELTLNPEGAPNFQDISGNYLDPYVMSFTVAGEVAYQLMRVPADSGKGFQWPYYLCIPSLLDPSVVLLVEPNNSGFVNDDPLTHEEAARALAERRASLAVDLRIPLLVPAFPRPASQWQVYVQALDRDTLTTDLAGLERVDLQLIAMIDDARERLADMGIRFDRKVFLNGFSASGSFVNRFTLLHPERVKGAASGSGGCPTVPVSQWDSRTLRYPAGIADLGTLIGSPFNLAAYSKVPTYIYVGDQDSNDAVDFPDGFDDEDRALIYEIFGDPFYIYERWLVAEQIYDSVQASSQFVVYPGVAHTITYDMWEDIKGFFMRHKRNGFSPGLPLLLTD